MLLAFNPHLHLKRRRYPLSSYSAFLVTFGAISGDLFRPMETRNQSESTAVFESRMSRILVVKMVQEEREREGWEEDDREERVNRHGKSTGPNNTATRFAVRNKG
ncbi:hypothetical protein BDQ12DRAFT_328622 [Crucibulum laeve]|uniref:Uncharacterized protein n=1 Tax=Crucibulum laeve TaxID=68775 RepID=A0A5C3LPL3_9AGAR|nr:hypothetical protein BDQ12DRAFT_328622 [Crucibulum laeve]